MTTTVYGEQLFEAIFCEAAYLHFHNLDLANHQRPFPRGQLFLNRLEGLIQKMNEDAVKPRIRVVSN